MLAAGWVRCRRSAAARTLPSRAICTNTSSWRGLMLIISLLYILDQIFQVFFMENDADNGNVSGVEGPVEGWSAGLRIQLCGPSIRQFLIHKTSMAQKVNENPSPNSPALDSTNN